MGIKTELVSLEKSRKLKEAKDFFQDRIKGWMIVDLERSSRVGTNFLTALGCFVYTEITGIFLPPLDKETGSPNKKRFDRCLFRLRSKNYLFQIEKWFNEEINKSIYDLRHSMAHTYYPSPKKRLEQGYLFVSSVVARDGFVYDISSGNKKKSSPIFFDNNQRLVIATRNYISEIKIAYTQFYKKIFIEKDLIWQEYAIKGADIIHRGIT